jgi:hypothetical protein
MQAPFDPRDFPRSCGKVKFPSRDVADQVLRHILATKSWRRKKPCRTYDCEDCGGAHITHLPAYTESHRPVAKSQTSAQVQRARAKKADDALERAKRMREESIARMNDQRSA